MTNRPGTPTSSTLPFATLLLDGLRRSALNHIVHIGGGDGTLLASLLQQLPSATGALFDDRAKIAASGPVLDAAGVTERVDAVVDDGVDPVPAGGDLYLLTALPASDPDHTMALLRRCHGAMAASARLLVCRPTRPVDWSASVLTDLLERVGLAPVAFDAMDPAWTITAASPTSTSTK